MTFELFGTARLRARVARVDVVAGDVGRAIAGLSQGGFCSMSYAARHPDLGRRA